METMSVLLAVMSYPGANHAVDRHYQHWLRAGADAVVGIGTVPGRCRQMDGREDPPCRWPEGMESVEIGGNSYIDGPHLPKRVLDTLKWFLSDRTEDYLCLIEWDTIFLNPLPALDSGMSAHLAGGKPWNLACNYFLHNPYCFDRETAQKVVDAGFILLAEGECVGGSPDTFLGWLTERFKISLRTDLWTQFSRNSFDCEGELDRARDAIRAGADVCHGVKHAHELEYILS